MAANLTDQVRNIAKVATAIAAGDLQQKIVVDAKGEILELKNTVNTMVDQLSRVRRSGDARRSRGRHRRQARRPGLGRRRPRYVEGADRQRQPDGVEPDQPGPRHLGRRDRDRARRHDPQDLGRGPRRAARPQERHQHDGRHAVVVRRRGDPRRARRRCRRQARWSGRGARRRRHVEGADRQRQPDGVEPDQPGARHRRRDDRRRERRPDPEDHRRGPRRAAPAEEHDQHDGRSARLVRIRGDARRSRGRSRRRPRWPGRGPRRVRHVARADRQRERHGA